MKDLLKKRWLAILILSILGAVSVWVLFFRPSKKLSALVPDHAAWYLEVSRPDQVLKEIEETGLMVSDSGLTFLKDLQRYMKSARAVFPEGSGLPEDLLAGGLGISAHPVSDLQTGYVFYLECRPELKEAVLSEIERKYRIVPGFRVEKREFLGETILEISEKNAGTFSLSFVKSAVIGSFSGFLIEDILRNAGVLLKPNFASRLSSDPRYRHLEGSPLRLFLQTAYLPVFLKRILQCREIELLHHSAGTMVLGLQKAPDKQLAFQGFCLNHQEDKIQEAVSLAALGEVLPQKDLVLSFAFARRDLWKVVTVGGKRKDTLAGHAEKALGNEILIGLSEGLGLKKYDRVLVAAIKDQKALERLLEQLAGNNTIPFDHQEDYRGIRLYKHRDLALASRLAGSSLEGWSPAHYAFIGRKFVISDQMELLRRCVDVSLNPTGHEVMAQTGSSQFSFRMHPSRMVSAITESSNGVFRQQIREWLPFVKAFRQISISDLGEAENPGIEMSISFRFPGNNPDSLPAIREYRMDTTIAEGPFRLGSFDEGNGLFLVQDKGKKALFINENLSKPFSAAMPDYWVAAPDELRTDHLSGYSVLFTFPGETRSYNQKAEKQGAFSWQLPDSLVNITHSSPLDFGQSLNYRLFLATRYGDVVSLDSKGKIIPGWGPRKCAAALALSPEHMRIAGKDYVLLLDIQGNLLVTNQKGQTLPGFPYKLKGSNYVGWFLEPGLNEESSFVYCLSDLGQMEKISLRASEASYLQLFRPDLETRFVLCPDQRRRTFVLARQGKESLTLFDQSYRPVLEHRSQGKRFQIRHFQFGSSNKIYTITDLDARICTIYNESGEKVLKKPVPADAAAEVFRVSGTDNRFRLLTVSGQKILLYEFVKD